MGKSTISMAIFNSYVSHYQRVTERWYYLNRSRVASRSPCQDRLEIVQPPPWRGQGIMHFLQGEQMCNRWVDLQAPGHPGVQSFQHGLLRRQSSFHLQDFQRRLNKLLLGNAHNQDLLKSSHLQDLPYLFAIGMFGHLQPFLSSAN